MSSDGEEHEEVKLSDSHGEAEFTLNVLVGGVLRPSLMRLMAWIRKFEVSLLVDSGLTHNFINSNIVTKVGLKSSSIIHFEVKVANRKKLKCETLVKEVKINIQGVRVTADLHVLTLVRLNVVLVMHGFED